VWWLLGLPAAWGCVGVAMAWGVCWGCCNMGVCVRVAVAWGVCWGGWGCLQHGGGLGLPVMWWWLGLPTVWGFRLPWHGGCVGVATV